MNHPGKNRSLRLRLTTLLLGSLIASYIVLSQDSGVVAQNKRPMAFMDIMEMRQATAPAISPDGRWALYTLNTPDWKTARSYTDIYLVGIDAGLTSTRAPDIYKRQERNFAAMVARREVLRLRIQPRAPARPRNSESALPDAPRRRRSAQDHRRQGRRGAFAFSRDGKWLAFSAGKEDEQQIWVSPVGQDRNAQAAAVDQARDARRLRGSSRPTANASISSRLRASSKTNKERKEKKFDVRIRNEEPPLTHLWAFDLETKTGSASYLQQGLQRQRRDDLERLEMDRLSAAQPNDRYRARSPKRRSTQTST